MNIQLLSFEELNFVQIGALPQGKPFEVCSKKSRYLHGEIFGLFQHCFELASSEFDYYSSSSYNASGVVALRNHLVTTRARLSGINNSDEFERYVLKHASGIDFVNTMKEENLDWIVSWEKLRNQLLKVGEDLIELIDKCIDEDLILWVKGF